MKKKKIYLALLIAVCFAMVLSCVACAPAAPTNGSDAGGSDGGSEAVASVAIDWSADSDCALCHSKEQESYADSACLANLHEAAACMDCHSDELATVHKGATADGKMPKKLKKTEVANETCLACHHSSKEALVEATPDAKVNDSEGTSVNPHALPASESHDGLLCADCHAMHVDEPISEQASETCQTCHHADVFECGTCHEA